MKKKASLRLDRDESIEEGIDLEKPPSTAFHGNRGIESKMLIPHQPKPAFAYGLPEEDMDLGVATQIKRSRETWDPFCVYP